MSRENGTGPVSQPLIECRGLCKDYRMGAEVIHALRDVDLHIGRGEHVAVTGASGSGKSTLIRLISTLLLADEGTIHFFGINVEKQPLQVQKLINRIFSDGQLDNCELTLRDLHNIAKSFNTILNGIHHHRIEYPEKRSGTLVKKRGRNGSSDRQSARSADDTQLAPEENGHGHLKRLGLS